MMKILAYISKFRRVVFKASDNTWLENVKITSFLNSLHKYVSQ